MSAQSIHEFNDSQLLHQLNDIVCAIDADEYIVYANRKFQRALGYRKKDIGTIKLKNIIEKKQLLHFCSLLKKIRQGKSFAHAETSLVTTRGNSILVSANLSGLVIKSKFIASTCVFHDITTQRSSMDSELARYVHELEEARKVATHAMSNLRKTNERLKELDHAKTDFLNVVSHELKTPLTAIIAYLDVLDDFKSTLNESVLEGFGAIRRNSYQLKSLVDNILEMSRIGSGKFELLPANYNIRDKVGEIITNLRALSDAKNITLESRVPNMSIVGDEGRLEEILNNLIGNAIKFTENGTIFVDVRQEGDFMLISVKDNGVGIPKEKVPKLFKEFYQVDSPLRRRHGGTGLGLSIVERLVSLQGGKVWVESSRGKGATFFFTLPIQLKTVKGGTK